MRARAGLDTEQLLPAGLAPAGDSGDQSAGSVCVCWHSCEPWAQRVSGCTTMLTPEGGLHTQVCSLGGDLSPPQSLCGQGGCGSQGTTVAGRIQSCHRSEHHPGAANHGQHWGPPEWPRTLCPARLSQAASCGFVSGHGARCITCLLVPRAGAGGDPVGCSLPRGFALRAAFPALGKGCKQGPVPHPATLATQSQPLPWHRPGVPRPGRHGMPDTCWNRSRLSPPHRQLGASPTFGCRGQPRVLGLHGPHRSLLCPSCRNPGVAPGVPPGMR